MQASLTLALLIVLLIIWLVALLGMLAYGAWSMHQAARALTQFDAQDTTNGGD